MHKRSKITLWLAMIIFAAFFISGTANAALEDGLTAHYTFDEGSGQSAQDITGNNADGNIMNGAVWTTGHVGSGALLLDGVDDYVDLGNPTFDFSNQFSISVWVNIAGATGNYQYILEKGPYVRPISLRMANSSRKLQYILRQNTGTTYLNTPNYTITYGDWQLLTLVYDGAQKSIYIDDTLVGTQNISGTVSYPDVSTNLGCNMSAARCMNGSVDDFRVYNRVLSAEEVTALYNQTGTVDPTVPNDPSDLSALAMSSSQIDLTWSDNSYNETNFVLERSTDGVNFSILATVSADITSYSDTGLTKQTTYYYRVKAVNGVGDSNYTLSVSATTLDTGPADPSGANANPVSSSQITISWFDNADNEDAYRIERSLDGVNYNFLIELPVDSTNHSDLGLNHNTTYYYRIQAVNSVGNSQFVETNATTLNIPPSAPSLLNASAVGSAQIYLSWVDNASNETGFVVERSSNGVDFSEFATLGADSTNYSDTTLGPAETAFYRVRAINEVGSSGFTNISSATTSDVPPEAPTNLVVVAVSDDQLDLTWEDNSDNELGFKVYRSEDGIDFIEISNLDPDTTSFSDCCMGAGRTFYYKVVAYNVDGGNSESTEVVSATTWETIPQGPTNLMALADSPNQVTIYWTDNADNEDNYRVERSLDGANFANIAEVGENIDNYIDQGLQSETTYYYRVSANNSAGASDYSNVANITTPEESDSTLTEGLTAHYTFDEGAGQVAGDSSGVGSNGTLMNNPTWVAGHVGSGALQLDGVDDYVDLGNQTFDLSNQFSVSAWVNVAGETGNYQYLLEKGAYVRPLSVRMTNSSRRLQYILRQSSGTTYLNSPNHIITYGDWQHIALLFDGSQKSLYIDGILMGTQDIAGTVSYPDVSTYLGCNMFGQRCMNGSIDDVRVYNRVLTPEEITALYNQTGSVEPTAPNAPSNLSAQAISASQIDMIWSDNSINEEGFVLERSINQTDYAVVANLSANTQSYSDSGLSQGTTYYYRIKAQNAVGESDYSNSSNATTESIPTEVPQAPILFSAQALGSSRVLLNWDHPDTSQVDGYRIRVSVNGSAYSDLIDLGEDTNTYTHTGLTELTQYAYLIDAYNVVGYSSARYADATTTDVMESQVINHFDVDKFEQIPDVYLDIVKTWAIQLVGQSHGRQLPHGLQLLEQQDSKYDIQMSTNLDELTAPNALKVVRSQYRSQYSSWGGVSTGDIYYWAAPGGRQMTQDSMQESISVGEPFKASIWAWSWHIGKDGWAHDEDGSAMNFNDERMDAYLNALATFNSTVEDSPFIYLTSITDGLTIDERGWRNTYYNDVIRTAAGTSGGILFDQADIENWNEAGTEQRTETWDGNTLQLRHNDYNQNVGADTWPDSGGEGDHTNDANCIRKAKALWVLLAKMAGWDGN